MFTLILRLIFTLILDIFHAFEQTLNTNSRHFHGPYFIATSQPPRSLMVEEARIFGSLSLVLGYHRPTRNQRPNLVGKLKDLFEVYKVVW